MKKALLIVVIMLIPAMTLAENPDSRPSISFAIGGDMVSGKSSIRGFNQEHDGQNFGFSGRMSLPVSSDVTLLFGLQFRTGETEWEENIFFREQTTDYTGFGFKFRVKFYIGDSINK